MKEIKHIPSLRDMEWSKEDFIIFQLRIFSRELIFANLRTMMTRTLDRRNGPYYHNLKNATCK